MSKKNALIIGIANESSISAGIAQELFDQGYQIYATYLNEKSLPYVKKVTDKFNSPVLFPFKVGNKENLWAIVDYFKENQKKIDVFIHGIAFASEIKKELHEVSWKSFKDATRISAFSLIEITQELIKNDVLNLGSSILTISYRGSQVAIEGYNMMGPVKNILEELVRGLASEIGMKGIRVNAISPGPIMTRAASGINDFDKLIQAAKDTSPLGRTASLEDIGKLALGIIENQSMTGTVNLIDCGESVSFTLSHHGES